MPCGGRSPSWRARSNVCEALAVFALCLRHPNRDTVHVHVTPRQLPVTLQRCCHVLWLRNPRLYNIYLALGLKSNGCILIFFFVSHLTELGCVTPPLCLCASAFSPPSKHTLKHEEEEITVVFTLPDLSVIL